MDKNYKMGSEKAVIKSINDGEEKSFEFLFRTYYARLCAFAVRMVYRNDVAEDIVTEVFVRLWEKQETIHIHDSALLYLFRATKNSCINYIKREKYRNLTISENESKLLNLKTEYSTSEKYLLMGIFNEELEEKINSEIEKLPEQCRKIFYLSRYEDLSHREIAEKLNISENTVKVHIYRALTKLRKGLKYYLPILF